MIATTPVPPALAPRTDATDTRTSKPRQKRRRAIQALVAMAATCALLSLGAAPVQAAYSYWATDKFNFSSSNSAVRAWGNLNWFKDPRAIYQPAIYRGQYD